LQEHIDAFIAAYEFDALQAEDTPGLRETTKLFAWTKKRVHKRITQL
jgi:hypothetical protein